MRYNAESWTNMKKKYFHKSAEKIYEIRKKLFFF